MNTKATGTKFALVMAVALFVVFSAASAWAAPLTLKFAGIGAVEHSSTKEMNQFAKNVEEKSDGGIKVRVFPASQLGDYTLVYEEITKGTVDMALIPIPTEYDSRHQITLVPGLAKDYKEIGTVFAKDSWLYNVCDKLHKDLDVVFLGFQIEGFGGIGSVKPVNEPLDPNSKKDMLCRISTMELDKFVIDAMNYSSVTIPYADLYTALQTGVVEGWYGGAALHSYEGYRDILKNYYNLNLFVESYQFVVSKKTWDKLTPEQQTLIVSEADDLCKRSVGIAEEEENHYLQLMKEGGMNVYTYSADELAPLHNKIQSDVWKKLDKLLGKELADDLQKQMAKN